MSRRSSKFDFYLAPSWELGAIVASNNRARRRVGSIDATRTSLGIFNVQNSYFGRSRRRSVNSRNSTSLGDLVMVDEESPIPIEVIDIKKHIQNNNKKQ